MAAEIKVGDEIHIYHLWGKSEYDGAEGIVESIDDAGRLRGTWGGVAVIPEKDYFRKIENMEGEEDGK